MAPPKRLKDEVELRNRLTPTVRVPVGRMVTRSLTHPDAVALPQPPAPALQSPRRTARGKAKSAVKKDEAGGSSSGPNPRTITIEHSKQCYPFIKKGREVMKGLKQAIPGIIVKINPRKPRKGCFEVREEGGEILYSLLDLEKPFQQIKDLEVEKVTADTVAKLQA